MGLGTLRSPLAARRSPLAAAVFLGLFGLAGMVWNVLETTVVQRRSPAGMLGRSSSAFRTCPSPGRPSAGCSAARSPGVRSRTPALPAAALPALAPSR
ncbi:hypothetical protein ACGFWI_29455 [Streptomyces sp. NPDC048434]|uniref:hypothetical protein n=1 Tax=Streptomyces sp. NPDC048434 TaxID=3365549 RepID=UPI003717D057